MYDASNFFELTTANFVTAEVPNREADYVSNSGSEYWYTEDGVYRLADHWGSKIASCDWYLNGENTCSWSDEHGERCGFCKWSDFGDKYPFQNITTDEQFKAFIEYVKNGNYAYNFEWNSAMLYMGYDGDEDGYIDVSHYRDGVYLKVLADYAKNL